MRRPRGCSTSCRTIAAVCAEALPASSRSTSAAFGAGSASLLRKRELEFCVGGHGASEREQLRRRCRRPAGADRAMARMPSSSIAASRSSDVDQRCAATVDEQRDERCGESCAEDARRREPPCPAGRPTGSLTTARSWAESATTRPAANRSSAVARSALAPRSARADTAVARCFSGGASHYLPDPAFASLASRSARKRSTIGLRLLVVGERSRR